MAKILPIWLSSEPSHEDEFLSRHPVLFQHAVKIARGNREQAEDLLQDTYLHFTQAKPDLSQVQNLDAYLYTILRNLQSANLRKGMRDPLGYLAAADFDSAELSLQSRQESNSFEVCDELMRIGAYSLAQRKDSRSQSLFLIRFFHGYYMDELGSISGNSFPTLKRWLAEAQAEIRHMLRNGSTTERFKFKASTLQRGTAARPEEFLRLLRQSLLDSAEEECPSFSDLHARYKGKRSGGVATHDLAHLAACGCCLESVNEILGLPRLAERQLENMDQRGRGPRSGPGMGGGSGSNSGPNSGSGKSSGGGSDGFDLARAQRAGRATAHHEPKRLIVRVDGVERAAQDLTGESHRFVTNLGAREHCEFIEIVSEQDVRLLSFCLDSAERSQPVECVRSFAMSGGRMLKATIRYADNWPSVEVSFSDPRMREMAHATSAALSVVPPKRLLPPDFQRWNFMRTFRAALRAMDPLLTTAVLLGVASTVCLFAWLHRATRIEPSAVLHSASSWDLPLRAAHGPGVVYQRVMIRAGDRRIEREIYRDVDGHRRPREPKTDASEGELKRKLGLAGIEWNQPLAVTSYRDWQDRAKVRQEAVTRGGGDRLTLVAETDEGPVAKETLTVRQSDFHPVGRTVEFRNHDSIEIAELAYAVLPWEAVGPEWFEPGAMAPDRVPTAIAHPHLALKTAPSEEELDLAELAAKLALARLNVDSSERVQVTRSHDAVLVAGIVTNQARKSEIDAELRKLPHVSLDLRTFGEMAPAAEPAAGTVVSAAVGEATTTPLEGYLAGKGMKRDAIGDLSHRLYNAALDVRHESVTLVDLLSRFDGVEGHSTPVHKTLDELVTLHSEKLSSALTEEQDLLDRAGAAALVRAGQRSPSGGLDDLSRKNIALCNELLLPHEAADRNPELVLSEMLDSVASLRRTLITLTR